MKFRTFAAGALAASVALLAASCATMGTPAWSPVPLADPAEAGFSKEGLDAIDRVMAEAVDKREIAGAVTMVGRGGRVVDLDVFGKASLETGAPMTEDTIFRIYSMTKPITGVALMQLHEQGKWTLDDPVTKFVPEFEGLRVLTGVDANGKAITTRMNRPPTMRELMSHTAGLAYGLQGDDPANAAFRDRAILASASLEEMIDKIADTPLLFQPGERWYYSAAVDVQGAIVERLSGKRFSVYLKENLFDPLGMTDTAFFVTPDRAGRFAAVYRWNPETRALDSPGRAASEGFLNPARMESGGGGLVSTIADYARFCQMMLNGGELDGRRVLKPESIALMTQNHIGGLRLYSDGTSANPGLPGVGFGLDFAVVGDPAAAGTPESAGSYYWGGAAGTWFWIDPVKDLYYIGMIQRLGGSPPGTINLRARSRDLLYAALTP